MSWTRFRPVNLLPVLAIVVGGAILAGGIVLSRLERFERVKRDMAEMNRFSRTLQERLDSLDSNYRAHLDALCRSDLSDRFALRDAMDRVVGVNQLSTLNPAGKVDLHLLASEVSKDEGEIPLPVLNRNELPVGRVSHFLIESIDSLGGGRVGSSGWLDTPETLFFYLNLSERRTVLVLIDRDAVNRSVIQWLEAWIREEISRARLPTGADTLVSNEKVLASVGDPPDQVPDLAKQLAFRFGNWQIKSWDSRRKIVEYDRRILFSSALLAGFVALAGGISFFYLNRALRLAERRVSFVNQISHELKTPLTNIILNADLAVDGADPTGRRRLAMIQEESRRLSRLIDNVLTYAQRDRRPPDLSLSPVSLHSLIEEVAAQFRPSLERRGIALSIVGDPSIRARVNSDALLQILGNLLSNIEKYAASGGIARIETEATGTDVLVRVIDAGPGIPRNERERIFLPFHRLGDELTEGASGTGLGLSIARDLAERMGGGLHLRSETSSSGAVFELRIFRSVDDKVITFPDSRAS
ncbi:MAG: HAMP domain-containing sensor histidine kinase [Verrucomicrobiales bacterium]